MYSSYIPLLLFIREYILYPTSRLYLSKCGTMNLEAMPKQTILTVEIYVEKNK